MKNVLRFVFVAFVVILFSGFTIAQQSVAPPPKPASDAPANAAVLKLLQVGMPESVVLDKIHAITDKFDTSVDALVTLKQAGATEAELKAIMAQSAAPAEQPPAAAPADTGPSLAETMQFIQNKLNSFGTVSFVAFVQNTSNGATGTSNDVCQIDNVIADQNQCRISFHYKDIANRKTVIDLNEVIQLRDVQEIVVKPEDQLETEWNASSGSPDNIITSTSPTISSLLVHQSHGVDYVFRFYDADLADRVAKAMLHAVELCGGGNKEKF